MSQLSGLSGRREARTYPTTGKAPNATTKPKSVEALVPVSRMLNTIPAAIRASVRPKIRRASSGRRLPSTTPSRSPTDPAISRMFAPTPRRCRLCGDFSSIPQSGFHPAGHRTTIPAIERMESVGASRRHVVGTLAWQLALLAGVGLFAIGASGVVALSMRAAFGDRFVAGDAEGIAYTAERCADFLEYVPGAADCEAAASGHHADEVVFYRIGVGLPGTLVLAG